MSVSKAFSKAHLMRLAGKPGWPREIEAIRELVSALENHAQDEVHAKNCIDCFSLYSERCPTAFELVSELFTTGPGIINRHAGCLTCQGMGFVSTEIDGYAFARRCPERRPPAAVGEQT